MQGWGRDSLWKNTVSSMLENWIGEAFEISR